MPPGTTANGETLEYRNISINDDNTYNYTKVKTTINVTAGSYIVKSGKQIEVNRDPVYSRFVSPAVGSPYVYIITHVWTRPVINQVSRSYSVTHPDLSNAGDNQIKEVQQILPNLFAIDTTDIVEGEWCLSKSYKTIEPVPTSDNTPKAPNCPTINFPSP